LAKKKKKETFASTPDSHDIEWWFDVLTSSKLALAEGQIPNPPLLVPTPRPSNSSSTSSSSATTPSLFKPMRNNNKTPVKPALRRRQPRLASPVPRFERFTVYETLTHFYLVGSDRLYSRFRLISLDRTVETPSSLSAILQEDPHVYNWEDMEALLQTLDVQARMSTKSSVGLLRAFSAVAIVGFIRFLQGYYMILVTQRTKIGCIGGHFIYAIQGTQYLPIRAPKPADGSTAWTWVSRWLHPSPITDAEERYLGLFHFVDLTKDFFYSYTYDLTHTLQHNMTTDQTTHGGPFVLWCYGVMGFNVLCSITLSIRLVVGTVVLPRSFCTRCARVIV
jgi:hypothetical protein